MNATLLRNIKPFAAATDKYAKHKNYWLNKSKISMELNFCSLSTFLCQHNLTRPCTSLKSSHLKSNKSLIIFPTPSFRKMHSDMALPIVCL